MGHLNPDFHITGMEITSHEEDPGLGGEIEKEYFKKSSRANLLKASQIFDRHRFAFPEDYRRYLETKKWQSRQ